MLLWLKPKRKKSTRRKRKSVNGKRKRIVANAKRLKRNVWKKSVAKRNRPSATALPEHSVSVALKATARAMQKPEQVTREARSVTPTTEPTKA